MAWFTLSRLTRITLICIRFVWTLESFWLPCTWTGLVHFCVSSLWISTAGLWISWLMQSLPWIRSVWVLLCIMVRFSGVSTRFWRLYAGEESREARLQLCFAQSGSKLHIYLNVFLGEDGHVCVRSIVYYSQCLFSLRITSLLSLSEQFSVIFFSVSSGRHTHTHTIYFREYFINTRHSWQSEWVRGDRNWVKEGWRLVRCMPGVCVCLYLCMCVSLVLDWLSMNKAVCVQY